MALAEVMRQNASLLPPRTPAPDIPAIAGQGPGAGAVGTSPAAIYEAFKAQRHELADQLERLTQQREQIAGQLRTPDLNSVDQKALEQRLISMDARIGATEKLLAEADAAVARAAGMPGAVVEPPPFQRQGPPEEVFVLGGLFIVVVLLPISIAFARRIWKRGAAAVASIPQDIHDRFARVDQSLDAIAIEVERIGEGQRFLTRMQTEQRAIGAGPAERIEVLERAGEREKQGRPR